MVTAGGRVCRGPALGSTTEFRPADVRYMEISGDGRADVVTSEQPAVQSVDLDQLGVDRYWWTSPTLLRPEHGRGQL